MIRSLAMLACGASCALLVACGQRSGADDDDPSRGGRGQGGTASAAGAAAATNGGKGAGGTAGTSGVSGMSLGGASGGGTGGRGTSTGGASGLAGTGNEQAGSDDGGTGSPGSGSSGGSGIAGRAGSGSGGSAGGCAAEPPTLLFLVDTSQSMKDEVGGLTKMALTAAALQNAFANLPSDVAVGLMLFPHVEIGAVPCFDASITVPLDVLDEDRRTALDAAIAAAEPSGSTPTHDAYQFALEQLKNSTLEGPQYVVLITDGAPTYSLGCVGSGMTGDPVDAQPLVDQAAAARDDGIKTFVVGSPGSEAARGFLSAMARLGGTSPADCSDAGPNFCHFDMTQSPDFGGALAGALQAIGEQSGGSHCP
jgi:hypothetical protein